MVVVAVIKVPYSNSMKTEIIEIINRLHSEAVLMFLRALLQEIAKDEEAFEASLRGLCEEPDGVSDPPLFLGR